MDTPTHSQVRQALKKVANLADFCRRHGIPERTVRRMRSDEEKHKPIPSILLMVTLALRSDGITVGAPPAKRSAPKRRAAA